MCTIRLRCWWVMATSVAEYSQLLRLIVVFSPLQRLGWGLLVAGKWIGISWWMREMQCLMLLAASCYRNQEIPSGVSSFLWKIVYIWNVLVTSTDCITPRICFKFITKKGNKKRWWCIMMIWRGKMELMNLWWAIKKLMMHERRRSERLGAVYSWRGVKNVREE